MSIKTILPFVLAAVCFGSWPLIVKRSGLDALVGALVITGMTGVVIVIGLATDWPRSGILRVLLPAAVFAAVAAGVINGLGTVSFLKGINQVSSRHLAQAILILIVVQMAINEIGGAIFYGTHF